MTEKLRIDVQEMTLGEMAEAVEVAGVPDAAGFNFRQTAALAWIVKRRTDPSFTYDRALNELRIRDLDIVNEDDAQDLARGGGTGTPPPLSAVSGISVPPT